MFKKIFCILICIFSIINLNCYVFAGYNISSNSFDVSPQHIRNDLNSIIESNYKRLGEIKKYKEQEGGYIYVGNFDDNIYMYIYTKNDINTDKIMIMNKYSESLTSDELSLFEYYISNVIKIVDASITYTDIWSELNFDDIYSFGDNYFKNNKINYLYSVNRNNISFSISPENISLKNLNDNINLVVNGKALKLDIAPQIISGTTLVPIRGVFEELGADVEWNQKDKEIIIYRLNTIIRLKPESERAFVNNNTVTMETSPQIIDNRVMVSLRFISEAIDCNVNWDGATNTITVNSN